MSEHAVLSPSKASRWITCPGSVALTAGMEDTSSSYADEGTAAHAVAAARLLGVPGPAAADHTTSDFISVYTKYVRNAAEGKILLVEQRFDLERWTSEKGGKGTADAVIVDLANQALEVIDLKFGQGHVVDAEENEQLMLYALGALDVVELCYGEVKTIKLVIVQPRRDHISEWTISKKDLLRFGEGARRQGEFALHLLANVDKLVLDAQMLNTFTFLEYLYPTEKACLWCPAKASCPALEAQIKDAVFDNFEVLDDGGVKAVTKAVDSDIPTPGLLALVEQWVAAKQAWINQRLHDRVPTPGWKLVVGKKGNRKWRDEAPVEKLLKRLKFKKSETHEESLISLTKIEKLVPEEKWPLFAVLITQADGQPTAVPESDKRPEYVPASASDFANVDIFS